MGDDGVYGTGDGLTNAGGVVLGMAGGVAAGVVSIGGATAVAAEPSGAGVVVGLLVGTLVSLNLRSPFPFFEAKGEWDTLANTWTAMQAPLTRQVSDLGAVWQGESAEAFVNFMSSRVQPQISGLASAAGSAASACLQMATMLTVSAVTFITSCAVTIVSLYAANASGPFSPAVKWAIIGAWVALVTALITALISAVMSTVSTVATAGDGYRALVAAFGEDAEKVAKGQHELALVEATRLPADGNFNDPTGWEKE